MSNKLDAITHRPIREWRMSPPEILVAENGYIIRTYAPSTDETHYRLAANAEEVRSVLHAWADAVANDMRRSVERELEKALIA